MKQSRYAKYAYIILWVFWVMLFVRFGFRIGLIGLGTKTSNLSTALFTGVYCVLTPVSLILARKEYIRRVIWAAVPFCIAGAGSLLLTGGEYVIIPSVLLSAGSALLTAAFLFIYVYGLSQREQVVSIVVFLIAKPVFSMIAVWISGSTEILPYLILATAVSAAIGICGKFIDTAGTPAANKPRHATVKIPFWTLAGIYTLYAFIVFERMNCAFTLFVAGVETSVPYYMYFAGGFIMAITAYWLFVHKKMRVSAALNIFLFLAVIYFILSVASEFGLMGYSSLEVALFGLSDIVYVFLFVTAASISGTFPGKKIFMGFVFVFGLALACAFLFSHYLYIRYQSLYTIVYALTSLAMIAVCILMSPLLQKIETGFLPVERGKDGAESDLKKPKHLYPVPDAAVPTPVPLTLREKEIVELYLKGYSNQQVAETLYIAPATLKVHCRNIYNKLNITSRLELHLLFQRHTENDKD